MKHGIKIDADMALEVLEELKQARQFIWHRTDHPEDYLKGIDDAIEAIEGVIAYEEDLALEAG